MVEPRPETDTEYTEPVPLPARASELLSEALSRYRSRCFWNARPEPTVAGALVASARLRRTGDMEAWRLAEAIERAIDAS
jgi:hypothetical protein